MGRGLNTKLPISHMYTMYMGSTTQVHVHVKVYERHPQCKTNTTQFCAVQRVGIVLHSVFSFFVD